MAVASTTRPAPGEKRKHRTCGSLADVAPPPCGPESSGGRDVAAFRHSARPSGAPRRRTALACIARETPVKPTMTIGGSRGQRARARRGEILPRRCERLLDKTACPPRDSASPLPRAPVAGGDHDQVNCGSRDGAEVEASTSTWFAGVVARVVALRSPPREENRSRRAPFAAPASRCRMTHADSGTSSAPAGGTLARTVFRVASEPRELERVVGILRGRRAGRARDLRAPYRPRGLLDRDHRSMRAAHGSRPAARGSCTPAFAIAGPADISEGLSRPSSS